MGNYIIYIVSMLFVNFITVFYWHKLAERDINYKDWKLYVAVLLLSILCTAFNFMLPPYLKILCIVPSFILICYYFFFRKLSSSFSVVIIFELVIMLSEMIMMVFISIFVDNIELFMSNSLSFIVLNLGIACLLLISLKTPIPYWLYKHLNRLVNNMHQNTLILCSIITIILSALFMAMSYASLPTSIIVVCDTGLVILYAFIVIKLAYTNDKFNKITGKYETSLSSLKEYEDIMDKYKVDNHENKNQLLTIRNMVKAKDKTVINYIDKLVDNKIKDNENIFYKTSKIPEGGLRATIYSKLCKMKDAGIEYSLEIANDVRTVDLIKMGDDTMLNICKIVGVFLDNAIEAVEDLEEKDIIVEIFVMDNNLCIEISNNYKEEIAVDKISNKGYSTKGKGHGYGLSLVDELIKKDSNLENEKEISKDLFTQRLKIKM